MTTISADLRERMLAQRKRNIKQLAKCARYLKWCGWFPLSFMVRDAYEELAAIDHQLDQWIGPRP